MNATFVLIFAVLGGILPALFWLWFWIREDRLKPEPKYLLLATFIGGIVAVSTALFLEKYLYAIFYKASTSGVLIGKFWDYLYNFADKFSISPEHIFLVLIISPVIEEILKFIYTYFITLRRKDCDEPIDASIYLITAALGFAAIENSLFLLTPYTKGIFDGINSGNFRSIGPMLIHLISSAVIGMFIGFTFYKSGFIKKISATFGLLLAIMLHSAFNFFIILNEATHNSNYFWIACLGVWTLMIILLYAFDRIKKVTSDKACLITEE